MCEMCSGKRYVVVLRDDEHEAVERCDYCSSSMSDEEAAVQAQADGIKCRTNYPCYLVDDLNCADCAWWFPGRGFDPPHCAHNEECSEDSYEFWEKD